MAEEKMIAPIPGTVLSVKKRVGDSVNAGDIVLIIEAMKMENEIVAPRKGIIKEIRVSEGQNVKMRDLLYVIE